MSTGNWLDRTARQKLGKAQEWKAFFFEVMNDAGDVLIMGGVPTKTRKGDDKWDRKTADKCVVTKPECAATMAAFERETGKCAECEGSGQTLAGWHHIEGDRFRPCSRCEATGQAKGNQ